MEVLIWNVFDRPKRKPSRKTWGLEPQHYAFAVVGASSHPRGKGQPEFLRAAARITKQAPNARFIIIGRGNMRDQLETEIKVLGLEKVAWLTPVLHRYEFRHERPRLHGFASNT